MRRRMNITCHSGYRYSLRAGIFIPPAPLFLLSMAAAVALAMVMAGDVGAQQTDPTEGLRQNTPRVHALTDARIVVEAGRVLEQGTLVIRNGIIEAVGADVRVPADARVWRMAGRTLYPGLIDMYSDVGLPDLSESETAAQAQGATSWNPYLRSFVDVADVFEIEAADERGEQLRAQGITAVLSVPREGIIRGRPALVHLRGGPASSRIVGSGLAQSVTFGDGQRREGYPTSAIGAMALIRQSLLDADWYQRAHQAWQADPSLERPETNRALAALTGAARGDEPLLLEVATDNRLPAVSALTEEFAIELWLRGSGHEYRSLEIIERLARGGRPLVVPVNFPGAPAVDTPEDALFVTLAELRSWHLAPENPARLAAAGIRFALTADGLKDVDDFLPNLRRAVERGLDAGTALAALTTTPAAFLGIESTHGTLRPGRVANLVVTDGGLFSEGTAIQEVWVDGERFEVNTPPALDPRGEWQVVARLSDRSLEGAMTIQGARERLSGRFRAAGHEVALTSVRLADGARRLRVTVPGEVFGVGESVHLTATVSGDILHGWGEIPGDQRLSWRGERTAPAEEVARPAVAGNRSSMDAGEHTEASLQLPDLRPSMEYGRGQLPTQPRLLHVRNATIWTQGEEGIIDDGEMLIREGTIMAVGRTLRVPAGVETLDAGGGHVTPGLIDAHLHSGHSGGSERGHAIIPEVRRQDFLSLKSIWTYWQLAGGLTTAHLMHGSGSPIGGQNQIVKLRWGGTYDDLSFEGAPRTVKFALGENPIGWEDRYPHTRMGVEQIIRDHFNAALDYRGRWEGWEQTRSGLPPRRDLRMEALLEILHGDVHIHAHSYRHDEILMLTRLMQEFGAPVRAFHHAVEAYKVAGELAEAGVGVAIWTDWSSFKVEAYDATIYNARLLHDAGVVTALHSDAHIIAGRMNWEAAKLLRTGMNEQDALATVTLNTARVLGIDHRVGSLEAGKDADFVIWNGHPLSGFTTAQQTWIDGRRYFDVGEDREMRERVRHERDQLIRLARETQK